MVAWAGVRTVALGVFVGSLLIGCEVDSQSGGSIGYGGESGYAGSGSSSGSSSGGSVQPMLVVVDANRTMSANPGDGVGVFTQYASGGHWTVWWTCDTNKTAESCAFDITVSVATGTTISNVASQGLALASNSGYGDTLTQSSQQIEATTTTTTTLQSVTFDTVATPAGALPIITIDAKLSGQEDGSYFFFVQDDEINGDYQGTLTDPLMLEPQSL